MSIEQIINKAKKIRGENSLEVLKGEKEILERLDEIEENTNNENKEFNEKILIEIESYLKIKENFDELMAKMYNKEWISYCKPPFKDASCVIRYLGRYTHRVAISNNRIIKEENGEVTFKYRDYKDNKKQKEMTLKAEEFIRRFLLHILPPRFMKIRHYGLLGNRNKKTKLAICKKLTNTANLEKLEISTLEILKKTLGVDFNLCPVCRKGHLVNPNSS